LGTDNHNIAAHQISFQACFTCRLRNIKTYIDSNLDRLPQHATIEFEAANPRLEEREHDHIETPLVRLHDLASLEQRFHP